MGPCLQEVSAPIALRALAAGAGAGAVVATGTAQRADATDGLKPPMGAEATPIDTRLQDMADRQERVSISGVRLTTGSAVQCPQVRADDGMIYPVSSLPSDVAIGGRVRVSGFMAYVTTCTGPVLYAEDIVPLGR
jgi:hypothetical protein